MQLECSTSPPTIIMENEKSHGFLGELISRVCEEEGQIYNEKVNRQKMKRAH